MQSSQFYTLGGRALKAFLDVYILFRFRAGLLNERLEARELKDRVRDILARKYIDPEIVKSAGDKELADILADKITTAGSGIGADHPVTIVRESNGQYPRAYQAFPEVFMHPLSAEEKILLRAPVGYDGKHFQPEDCTALTSLDQEQIERLLFAPWGGSVPMHYIQGHGVALPDDYVSAAEQPPERPSPHFKTFVLNSRFQALTNVKGVLKQIFDSANDDPAADLNFKNFGGRLYLRLGVPEDVSIHAAGIEEVSEAEYNWFLENEFDLSLGIAPPPLPQELGHLKPYQDSMMALNSKDIRYAHDGLCRDYLSAGI